MAYREIAFVPQEFYHVYNRGNSKQNIFLDAADYKRFQDLLYLANAVKPVSVRDARDGVGGVYEVKRSAPIVAIGAYCLLPNHFHILVTPLMEDGLSVFMRKVSTGYAMYFNKRYTRTGTLFEGKFKAQHAGEDSYLKYLFAYIHLNPLKLKHLDWRSRIQNDLLLLKEGTDYPYSSYQDYVQDVRNESMIISKEHFPEYFETPSSWENEMITWIKYLEV